MLTPNKYGQIVSEAKCLETLVIWKDITGDQGEILKNACEGVARLYTCFSANAKLCLLNEL